MAEPDGELPPSVIGDTLITSYVRDGYTQMDQEERLAVALDDFELALLRLLLLRVKLARVEEARHAHHQELETGLRDVHDRLQEFRGRSVASKTMSRAEECEQQALASLYQWGMRVLKYLRHEFDSWSKRCGIPVSSTSTYDVDPARGTAAAAGAAAAGKAAPEQLRRSAHSMPEQHKPGGPTALSRSRRRRERRRQREMRREEGRIQRRAVCHLSSVLGFSSPMPTVPEEETSGAMAHGRHRQGHHHGRGMVGDAAAGTLPWRRLGMMPAGSLNGNGMGAAAAAAGGGGSAPDTLARNGARWGGDGRPQNLDVTMLEAFFAGTVPDSGLSLRGQGRCAATGYLVLLTLPAVVGSGRIEQASARRKRHSSSHSRHALRGKVRLCPLDDGSCVPASSRELSMDVWGPPEAALSVESAADAIVWYGDEENDAGEPDHGTLEWAIWRLRVGVPRREWDTCCVADTFAADGRGTMRGRAENMRAILQQCRQMLMARSVLIHMHEEVLKHREALRGVVEEIAAGLDDGERAVDEARSAMQEALHRAEERAHDIIGESALEREAEAKTHAEALGDAVPPDEALAATRDTSPSHGASRRHRGAGGMSARSSLASSAQGSHVGTEDGWGAEDRRTRSRAHGPRSLRSWRSGAPGARGEDSSSYWTGHGGEEEAGRGMEDFVSDDEGGGGAGAGGPGSHFDPAMGNLAADPMGAPASGDPYSFGDPFDDAPNFGELSASLAGPGMVGMMHGGHDVGVGVDDDDEDDDVGLDMHGGGGYDGEPW